MVAEVPHVVNGDGLVYETFAMRNVMVEGIAAMQSTMTTTVLDGKTRITVSGSYSQWGSSTPHEKRNGDMLL